VGIKGISKQGQPQPEILKGTIKATQPGVKQQGYLKIGNHHAKFSWVIESSLILSGGASSNHHYSNHIIEQ
jgi:hypothetical protein